MLPAPAEGSPVAACSRQCTWAARHIQQQQPPTEKFASSKMQCPLGRAEGRGSGHKSMPRRACVPRGLECERLVCQSRDVSPYAYRQRNDPAPLSLRRGAPECVWLRKFETYRSDVRLVAARDTRAAIVNQLLPVNYRTIRIRRGGRVRGRAPPLGGEGAGEPGPVGPRRAPSRTVVRQSSRGRRGLR